MFDKMLIQKRLATLADIIYKEKINAYVVTGNDPHNSEYPADYFNFRRWLTGFSGSAGTLVCLTKAGGYRAVLFTDSRYHIEAESVLKGTGIELFKSGLPDVPSLLEFLLEQLKPGDSIGFCGKSISYQTYKNWEKIFIPKKINLKLFNDLLTEMRKDPLLSEEECLWKTFPLFEIPSVYSGMTYVERKETLNKRMVKWDCDSILFSSLDHIAWLLNLRGRDIPYNPLFYSYFLYRKEGSILYLKDRQLSESVINRLECDGIQLADYPDDIQHFLLPFEVRKIAIHSPSCCSAMVDQLSSSDCTIIPREQFFEVEQAVRGETELAWTKKAMIADAIALIRSEILIEKRFKKGVKVTEIEVAMIIDENRETAANFLTQFFDLPPALIPYYDNKSDKILYHPSVYLGPSFETISGAGANGAIVHYRPGEGKERIIHRDEPILVDSGGQYLFGTTDITRVFCYGKPSKELKKAYSLVLKANFALQRLVFPVGTPGYKVDMAARSILWQEGLDYLHGTGHGVGFVLNVHEGPQSVSPRLVNQPLLPGMVISNEPGYYQEGELGVRFENCLTVTDKNCEQGKLRFELLTLYPAEPKLIDFDYFSAVELKALKSQNQFLADKLYPFLTPQEKKWLKRKLRAI